MKNTELIESRPRGTDTAIKIYSMLSSQDELKQLNLDLHKARRARALHEAEFSLVLLVCILIVAAYCK